MGEDVSGMIRTGITVILVAALITAVLNLMVVAQNIMASGLGTLESGVDQVTVQEFEKYNQKKLSGTSVKAAISLYQAKDIGIVVRTKGCKSTTTGDGFATADENKNANAYCFCYGSLLLYKDNPPASKSWSPDNVKVNYFTTEWKMKTGEAYYEAEYYKNDNGVIQANNNTKGITSRGDAQVILDSSRFQASLIRSASGAIIGIFFEQQ